MPNYHAHKPPSTKPEVGQAWEAGGANVLSFPAGVIKLFASDV